MAMPKAPMEIVEVTVGYSQNFHAHPTDKYVMSRAEMQLKAVIIPGIMDIKDVRNKLYARCVEGVREFIEEELAKTEAAEKFQ
jgi:hypothetical protein